MGEDHKMKTATKVLLGLGALALLWFTLPPLFGPAQVATPGNADPLVIDVPEVGQGDGPYLAPDFVVTTFEGQRFRLRSHKGTPVVLNFWESW